MTKEERRLLGLYATALLAILLAGGAALRYLVTRAVAKEAAVHSAFLDLALRDRSRYLASTLQESRARGHWPEDLDAQLTRNHADYNRDIFMQVFDADGTPVAASSNAPAEVALAGATRSAGPRALRWIADSAQGPEGRPFRLVTYPVYAGDPNDPATVVLGYAQAGLAMPDADRAVARFTLALAGILAVVGLVGLALARTLLHLASHRAKAGSEAIREAQHRFIADAAHELGTPLAILRGEIDIALRRDREASDYRSALESCREEIERLSRLSDGLLSLATADSGAKLLQPAPCDAAAIARSVHGSFLRSAADQDVELELRAPASLPWVADSLAVEQILGNLVSNALRHTPPGERVTLALEETPGRIVFLVEDAGEGIPAAHLPLIFDRFHRIDKARSRRIGGAGLGLAIVKALVEAHGGNITVESTLGQGSVFRCEFPASNPTSPQRTLR
jgi:signal transduction histidine kinase